MPKFETNFLFLPSAQVTCILTLEAANFSEKLLHFF
jgi:hypothetical protein